MALTLKTFKMASQAEPLSDGILEALAETGRVDSYKYATSIRRNHQDVVGAVKSLDSLGDVRINLILIQGKGVVRPELIIYLCLMDDTCIFKWSKMCRRYFVV